MVWPGLAGAQLTRAQLARAQLAGAQLAGAQCAKRAVGQSAIMKGLAGAALGCAALMVATGPVHAQQPKRGGMLNFAVVAEPPNYDCHASASFALVHPIAPHYSLLVKFDGEDYPNVIPDLAQSWTLA